jgi:polysaccharide deacetylase family protein (PEP-CTERM system associated)
VTATISPLRFENPFPVLSIDLEEWFCVCGDDYFGDSRRWKTFESRVAPITESILEALSAGGHRATFFVLGWIARRHPELVRTIAGAGHEIAYHGLDHRRCTEMSEEDLRTDLRTGRALLEPLSGKPLAGYRAPEWSIRSLSDPALRVLAEEGFRYDSSVTPVPLIGTEDNDPFPSRLEFSGTNAIAELPPLTGRAYFTTVLIGGSWAFRSVAFRSIEKAAARFRQAGAPPIFTFHPWEFDEEHPPLTGLPALLRLAHSGSWVDLRKRWRRLLSLERMRAIEDLF